MSQINQNHNKLLVVIPAYNEKETIIQVIKSIPVSIDGIGNIYCMVVDDGSTDNTAELAKRTGAIVISNYYNKGVGGAFRVGIDEALRMGADIMVNIDGDGQFNPADISCLLKPILTNEADFVTASRFIDKKFIPKDMSKIKIWGNKQVALLIGWLTKRKFYDVSCGFRAYNREALLNLNLFGDFTYTQETFLDLSFKGLRIKEVPIEVKYFKERESKIAKNLFSYTWKILGIIFKTLRDYKPLKFFGTIGISIFAIGVILDIFIFYHYFVFGSFSPYLYVAFTGAFLNAMGLIIFVVGLVTDMLDRIRMNQEKLLYYEKKRIIQK